jgi:hypothetical protein
VTGERAAPPERRLWVFNLDAELELAREGNAYETPLPLRRALATVVPHARRLMSEGDLCFDPDPGAPPGALTDARGASREPPREALLGAAWCPTPSALRRLARAGARLSPSPGVDVLRRVAHRRFALELGGGAPGARFVSDEAGLNATLSESRGPWLFKRAYGFAGRGQRRINGAPPADDRRWLGDGLRHGGLLAEPWLELTLELSLHGLLDEHGRLALGHVCVQQTDTYRAWLSTRRAEPGELEPAHVSALRASAESVAEALCRAGYFGPFGIDAYLYRSASGALALNALSELNPRYTMGHPIGAPAP